MVTNITVIVFIPRSGFESRLGHRATDAIPRYDLLGQQAPLRIYQQPRCRAEDQEGAGQ